MAKLESILKNLSKAEQRFLRSADSVSAEQWQAHPNSGGWSAAELVAHLIIVERTITGAANRSLQRGPKRVSLLKKVHLPLVFGEVRVIKLKSPLPLDLQLVREKGAMLGELREVRGRTLAFIDETKHRDLRDYRWRHPFLGSLNMYGWFQLIASHQVRHEKQLRKIAACLRKAVASLQK